MQNEDSSHMDDLIDFRCSSTLLSATFLQELRTRIWEYAQNRVGLICHDLWRLYGVPKRATARILMMRGVYKWLAARRDLIRLKNQWRDELTVAYQAIASREVKRGTPEYHRLRGRIVTLETCRAAIRAICHSERWRCPLGEPKAMRLLEGE